MKKKIVRYGILAGALLFLVCAAPQDPRKDPENAKLQPMSGVPTLVTPFQENTCTLHVVLPELADSITVRLRQEGVDTVVLILRSPSAGDSVHTFPFTVTGIGQVSLNTYLYRQNGTIDSLSTVLSIGYPAIAVLNCPAVLTAYQAAACTLHVTLPQLADSITVGIRQGAADSTIAKFTGLAAKDSVLYFSILLTSKAQDSLKARFYRKNVSVAQKAKAVSVRFAPSVTPDSTHFHIFIKQTAKVNFSITDPDGDIRSCQLWIDSTTGTAVSPPLSGVSRAAASISYDISRTFFDTVVVFAQALDSMGNASAVAACTVFVLDTAKPVVSLIRTDTLIKTLPCSLFVRLQDDSQIDSVKFSDSAGGRTQYLSIRHDTAFTVLTSLDSGRFSYKVSAWDKAGNKGVLTFSILYTGTVKYKLTVKSGLGRSLPENQQFPALWLDSCVTITPDPVPLGIEKWKDSIKWSVTALDTTPASLKATIGPMNRRMTFSIPDTEWNGTQILTLLAVWPGSAVASQSEIYAITDVPDPPRITWKSAFKKAGAAFDTVWADTCVFDPDNKSNSISWKQDTTVGHYYALDWLSRIKTTPGFPKQVAAAAGVPFLREDLWNRRWLIVFKTNMLFFRGQIYRDTLRVTATDPGGLSSTKDIYITATY